MIIQAMAKVIIRQTEPNLESIKDAIKESVGVSGILGKIQRGKPLFLKINCVYDRFIPGTLTSLPFFEAVVETLRPYVGKIIAGDGDDSVHKAQLSYQRLGYDKLCQRLGVKLINISEEELIRVPYNSKHLKEVEIPKFIQEIPNIISLPVLKTHNIDQMTAALKNQYGFHQRMRILMHAFLAEAIACINKLTNPLGAIMDATVAQEGNGPLMGHPVPMGLILASTDLVALDSVAAELIGLDPKGLETLLESEKVGVGSMQNIKIDGPELSEISRDFIEAKTPTYLKIVTKLLETELRPLIKLVFGPLYFGPTTYVQIYKNLIWYNFIGKPEARKFLKEDPWGKLFAKYLEGVSFEARWWQIYSNYTPKD